ncbi:AMP-binding protein [Myxococcota bacterium]|nr:AMP-binding protein [Myxococcota bacterium]
MAFLSFPAAYHRLVVAAPSRPAIVCDGSVATRAELERAALRRARSWDALGVREGDSVAIALPNGIAFFECVFAAWRLGAVPIPLSHRLPEAEQRAIVELAAPRLIIGAPADRYPDRIVLAEPPESAETSRSSKPPGSEAAAPVATSGASLGLDAAALPLPDRTSPNAHAIASGGSSGRPKLIVDANPARFDPDAAHYGMNADVVVLIPGPLFHTGPFLNARECLMRGGLVVLMSRFDPEEALRLIEAHRVQWVNLVPTMLHRIARLPEAVKSRHDLSSLERVVSSGAPCAGWLMREWIDWIGPDRMFEAYGGTERIGGTLISGREWLAHPGSVGRPTGGRKVRIVGDDGRELAAGEVGDVFFLPPGGQGSTYRYVGATARATEDGWETLGDVGYVDDEGFLYLVDRRTDMILVGGENVYPAEVEAAIDAHPGVGSSCVIGLPDEDLGQRIHAIVQADPGIEAALREHLAASLVRYKIPRTFEFVSEPLRDDAGKLRRSQKRAERYSPL